jgi:hypothetical protein
VESHDPVSMWVEHGTARHLIRPRAGGTLRFTTISGEVVEARVVHHPGQRAQRIVARALHEAWLAFPRLAQPALDTWAAKMRGE